MTYLCRCVVLMSRHPLPDRYSLTMEVAKDRTTEAVVTVCTAEDFRRGRCPDDALVGDRFLQRSLNGPCHRVVRYTRCLCTFMAIDRPSAFARL